MGKLETEEVFGAYRQRRENLRRVPDTISKVAAQPEERQNQIMVKDLQKSILDFEGEGFSYHTYDSLGKFTVFPDKIWKEKFPTWTYLDQMHQKSFVYGLMCKEEGLKLTYELS